MHKSTTLYNLVSEHFKKNQPEIKAIASRLAVKEKVYTPPNTEGVSVLERIIGSNDLVPVQFLLLALEKAKSVGRILVKNELDGLEGYGTGFLIAPNVLMTNHHVLPDTKTAAHSQVEFNYEMTVSGKPTKSVVFNLLPDTLYITSPEEKLDFTIVAVNKKSEDGKLLSAFGFLPVTRDPATLNQGQAVSIIQHPNGERKQLALRNNNITKVDGDLLMYTTDTLGGSSGSPIFNDAWDVAGLHHSGVPEMDSKGRILSVDGKVWQEWMGDNKVNWIANEGIQMSSIVKDILKRKLTAKQKDFYRVFLNPNRDCRFD